jgi:putative protease
MAKKTKAKKKITKKKPAAKKKTVRKAVKKTAVKRKPAKAAKKKKTAPAVPQAPARPKPQGKLIGTVSHYFAKVNVVAFKIKNSDLQPGDTIHIQGHTTDYKTTVTSIQTDHRPITKAKKGDEVGIRVPDRAREGDDIYKL